MNTEINFLASEKSTQIYAFDRSWSVWRNRGQWSIHGGCYFIIEEVLKILHKNIGLLNYFLHALLNMYVFIYAIVIGSVWDLFSL